jgi:hypothetical protein
MGILMIGYKVFKEETKDESKSEDYHDTSEEAETVIDKLNTEQPIVKDKKVKDKQNGCK